MKFFCVALFIGSAAAFAVSDAPYPPADIATNTISQGPYPPAQPGPSPTYTKWQQEPDQSFSVQSGYEGYLIPSEPELSFFDIIRTVGAVTLIPPLSKIGLKFAVKFGIWFAGFAVLFLIGSLVTTTVCTFTPLCTISFLGLGPFSRETVRSYISDERISSASQFLMSAIRKYRELNKKDKEIKRRR